MTGLDQFFTLKESVFDQWLTSFSLQLFHSELSVLFCFLCVINRKFMVTAWRSKMKFNLQIVLLMLINHSSAIPAFRDRGRILDSIIGYGQWRTRFNLCTNKRIKQKHVHILRMVLCNGTASGTIAIIHADFGRWMRLNCLLGYACLWCMTGTCTALLLRHLSGSQRLWSATCCGIAQISANLKDSQHYAALSRYSKHDRIFQIPLGYETLFRGVIPLK